LIQIYQKSFKPFSHKVNRKKYDAYQIEGSFIFSNSDGQGIFLVFENEEYWPFFYLKIIPSREAHTESHILKIGYHSKEENRWYVLNRTFDIDSSTNNNYSILISEECLTISLNDKDLGRCDLQGFSFPVSFYIKNMQDENSKGQREKLNLKSNIKSILNLDSPIKSKPSFLETPHIRASKPIKICGLICSKNGEKTLSHCLKCIENQLDYFVLLNNSSDDNTKNIMLEFKNKYPNIVEVIDFHTDYFDESAIRNKSIEVGKKFNPDWFMVVDDDELLEENFRKKIEIRFHDKNIDYITVHMDYCFGQTKYSYGKTLSKTERLFRNRADRDLFLRSNRLHVSVVPPSIRIPSRMFVSGIRAKHLTFSNFEDLRQKYISYRKNDILNEGQKSYHHFVKYMIDYKKHGISCFLKKELDYKCASEIVL